MIADFRRNRKEFASELMGAHAAWSGSAAERTQPEVVPAEHSE